MGDLHDDDDPALGGLRRPDRWRCSTPTRPSVPAARPVAEPARARHARASRASSSATPGPTQPVLQRPLLPGRARPDRRRHRLDRRRQEHAGQPGAAAVRRHRRRRSRSDGVDVRRLEPDLLWSRDRAGPAEGLPVQRDRPRPTCCTARPDATDEELWQALEIAQADDFVRAMPEGLDAPIVQGGTNVCGGQRQRLAIARAVVRRPEIYLFDDSFSALDLATDARLRAALRPVTRDATVADRRPTGLHDPRRRPDPRARGRPGGRSRHPPRAARRLPDLPGDRRLPAERRGGGMTHRPTAGSGRRRPPAAPAS